tara:strand:- start:229 stop:687 length:459 start_codon:yes stop_codon:yes gene_type:complete
MKIKNKRREFLKTACAPVVFSMFGVSILEACSSGDDDDYGSKSTVVNNSSSYQNQQRSVSIDLNDSSFSAISEIGGWMNYRAEGMLLLRISESEIRAYSNSCPHQGANNQWSYNNSVFTCGRHNNSFSDDCSNTTMTCYSSSIDGNTLTVTL